MRITALLLSLCVLLAAPPARAASDEETYAAAADAYRRGDMTAALQGFTTLAETGVIAAQENLAHMYANGEGGPADMARAIHWLSAAAEAGSVGARVALGALYYHGDGVAADPVVAYAWFSLASQSGPEDEAMAYLYKVAEQLSAEDIARARVLARQMYERFGLAEQRPAS